jgi:FkbM family methyltransferase
MKNEHLFNGFIATYPRNEIIYDALKHAYNAENNTLQSNYHYLCEELLRIVLSEQKKLSSQNMIIYQEYSDTIDGKGVGRFKNSNEETVFIHYWQDREIPSNLLLQNDNKMVMIPIGTFCYVARILEKLNYRYTSLPFDYTRTNIPMVNDCINNNFVDFLNKDNYTNNNQGIIKYGKDIFLHHDMGDVNVYNSMKRKTNRFLNIFDKHDIHKIYIAFFQPIGSWVDDTTVHQDGTDIDKIVFDLKQLYKTIHNRTENFHVIGIINKPSGRQCNKIIFNEENLSIYELETVTSIDGPTFTMKSDEVYSIKILKQILTTINPNFEKTHVINYENEIDREIPSNLSTLVMAYNNNYMVDNYHCTKGIKFLTYPPDKCIISELISKNHVWEPHMHNIFEKYINKESIVLEGGCHIGTHTLKLGLLGKQVLSFEPMIKSNIILRENLKINNITNVTVYNEGLSNKTEVAYFEWIGHNNPGGSGLTNNPMGKPNYEKNIKTSNYPVNLITIDSLQLEKLDFIKLDVEGYEINVIEGALDTIKKCNPIITMEVWENFNGKYSLQHAKSTFKILLDNGYTIHHIRGPDFLFLPSSTSSDFHF